MSFRSFTRRDLLKSTAAASITLALPQRGFADLLVTGASTPLKQLEYSQVTLLPGPMRQQFDQTQARFMGIDNDMLLKPFRQGAGLAAPGDDMGGWYSNSRFWASNGGSDGFVLGHSFGQYLSALSRGYAITGDRATQAKVEQLVTGLQPTLVSKFYDGYHLPGYTFDKTLCGLSDAHALAGVASAMPYWLFKLDRKPRLEFYRWGVWARQRLEIASVVAMGLRTFETGLHAASVRGLKGATWPLYETYIPGVEAAVAPVRLTACHPVNMFRHHRPTSLCLSFPGEKLRNRARSRASARIGSYPGAPPQLVHRHGLDRFYKMTQIPCLASCSRR